MKSQRPLHAIILQQRLAPCHFFKNLTGQILAVQEQAELRLVQRRIIEQRKKYLRRMMVQQRCQFFAGSRPRSLAMDFVTLHPIPSPPEPRPPRVTRAICRFVRQEPLSLAPPRRARQKTASAPSCLPS